MSLKLVTPAAEHPISLAEAKAHLRVDGSDEDTYITTLIGAAVGVLDGKDGLINRALITQTWDLVLDEFPVSDDDAILLPLPPTQSITSITYTDIDGNTQTMPESDYILDDSATPARLFLAYSKCWPSTRDIRAAVTIRFVAGYGAASDVPEDLKHALLLIIGDMYENRESVVVGTTAAKIPQSAAWLYQKYTAKGFG